MGAAVVELIYGLAVSLALLGDALTMLVDSLTYGLNWWSEKKKVWGGRRWSGGAPGGPPAHAGGRVDATQD